MNIEKHEPTPIEKFKVGHWNKLLEVEQKLVEGGRVKLRGRSGMPTPLYDLFAAELLEIGKTNLAQITDRGWEVVQQLRRWLAEHGHKKPFIVAVCKGCARLRYGHAECSCKSPGGEDDK